LPKRSVGWILCSTLIFDRDSSEKTDVLPQRRQHMSGSGLSLTAAGAHLWPSTMQSRPFIHTLEGYLFAEGLAERGFSRALRAHDSRCG
jgi:hypothetical protein